MLEAIRRQSRDDMPQWTLQSEADMGALGGAQACELPDGSVALLGGEPQGRNSRSVAPFFVVGRGAHGGIVLEDRTNEAAQGGVPALQGHSLTCDGEYLYVFGGRCGMEPSNTLYAYSIADRKFKIVQIEISDSAGRSPSPPVTTSGSSQSPVRLLRLPFSRASSRNALSVPALQQHACVVWEHRGRIELIFVGGRDALSGRISKMVHILTVHKSRETAVLRSIPVAGHGPTKGITDHVCACVGCLCLVACGNDRRNSSSRLYCFDLLATRWIRVSLPEDLRHVTHRESPTLTPVGNNLILFGGFSKKREPLDDVHILRVAHESGEVKEDDRIRVECRELHTYGDDVSRFGHCAALVGWELCAFGGYAHARRPRRNIARLPLPEDILPAGANAERQKTYYHSMSTSLDSLVLSQREETSASQSQPSTSQDRVVADDRSDDGDEDDNWNVQRLHEFLSSLERDYAILSPKSSENRSQHRLGSEEEIVPGALREPRAPHQQRDTEQLDTLDVPVVPTVRRAPGISPAVERQMSSGSDLGDDIAVVTDERQLLPLALLSPRSRGMPPRRPRADDEPAEGQRQVERSAFSAFEEGNLGRREDTEPPVPSIHVQGEDDAVRRTSRSPPSDRLTSTVSSRSPEDAGCAPRAASPVPNSRRSSFSIASSLASATSQKSMSELASHVDALGDLLGGITVDDVLESEQLVDFLHTLVRSMCEMRESLLEEEDFIQEHGGAGITNVRLLRERVDELLRAYERLRRSAVELSSQPSILDSICQSKA